MKLFFFYHCFFFHYHFSSCSTLEEKCYSLKCFHTNTFSVNQCSKLNRKTLQFIYLLWLVSPTRGRINHLKTRRLRALFLANVQYICINHAWNISLFSWYCNNQMIVEQVTIILTTLKLHYHVFNLSKIPLI